MGEFLNENDEPDGMKESAQSGWISRKVPKQSINPSLQQDLYRSIHGNIQDLFDEQFPELSFIRDDSYKELIFGSYHLAEKAKRSPLFGGRNHNIYSPLASDSSIDPYQAIICRYKVEIVQNYNPDIGNGESGTAYDFQRTLIFHWSLFRRMLIFDESALEQFGFYVLAAYRADYAVARLKFNFHLHESAGDFIYELSYREIETRLAEETGRPWHPIHFVTKPVNSELIAVQAYLSCREISSFYAETGSSIDDFDEVFMDYEQICVSLTIDWSDVYQMTLRERQLEFIDLICQLIKSGEYVSGTVFGSGEGCTQCKMWVHDCWCYSYPELKTSW